MANSIAVFTPGFRVLNAAGQPVSGAQIRFFQAGTTTPRTVYADSGLTAALGPIVYTRSDGLPAANQGSGSVVSVYTGIGAYKFDILDANGVNIYPTQDNVPGASAGIVGTVAADNAPAGIVGEVISSTILSGAAIALVTNTPANLTSMLLTAGDWDVWFESLFTLGATTSITLLQASISLVSATIDSAPGNVASYATAAQVPNGLLTLLVGPRRVNVNITTTLFAVANAAFTVSTAAAYGLIRARRVR